MNQPHDHKNAGEKAHPNPGESMNVRAVHHAIIRELPEPKELYKNVPWYLRHFYAVLLIGGILYLLILAGQFDWQAMDTPLEELSTFQK